MWRLSLGFAARSSTFRISLMTEEATISSRLAEGWPEPVLPSRHHVKGYRWHLYSIRVTNPV